MTSYVPPTATSVFINAWCQSNGAGPSYLAFAGYAPGSPPSGTPYPEWQFEVNGAQVLQAGTTQEIVFPTSTQQVYAVASAMTSPTLSVAGWRDNVNAN